MTSRSMRGFTLVELLVVLGIIAFLSMLAMPTFMRLVSKAKRSEAYMNLRSLYMAQKVNWIEKGSYSPILYGTEGIGWKPEGAFVYSYGFSQGGEGTSFFMGSAKAPASALAGSGVNDKGFIAAAAADIDGDGKYDVITIDQDGVIKIVEDDLS